MSGTIDSQSVEQTRPRSDRDVVYVGYRQRGRAIVEKQPGQERLTPNRSLELASHSPSGFEWGYGGSGPAQLALALLLDYSDDEEVALAQYTEFKNQVVSQLDCTGPGGRWRLTGSDIDAVLRETSDEAAAPSI
ncbi:DUF6166 domain-containing protein (plasmid) [Haloarcula sp. NS06]|uniref:Uncharacterized protein n=4 Tax=Halobacteriales TaxID=2235 RepID=B0R8T4_HALS3|nr:MULTISPECIES: DUF6166 domain-containing protein [Halobacteria]ELY73500.1 hypothetical protein C487_17125 [Natrinema pallidum DSM 3751]MBB6090951.1 hypothetical protein [Halobacterium salinarum]MDL0139409.1 DUF6166 domain-containing protein [Halobacterium salinarum]CAP15120.1 uncharacterized protein OE_7135R [Halobacterium salinarum R1]CAP15360.1 uncharacterized protein OE_6255R [Halobacterium salinarum R1]